MKYISRRYQEDISTAMGKSAEIARSYDDLINLSIGDPDILTDERVIEAAFKDALAGHTTYTPPRGDPELIDEIINFYKDEYDMDVDDEEVFVSTSACEGMYLALEAILDDGDEVIIQAPYFTPYKQQVELARGISVELPTYEDEGFQVDPKRLEDLITERTKALIINSPSNPTGSSLTTETMEEIANLVEHYDLLVIADDIYTAFSYEGRFVPFASLPGMNRRTITLNSFSKNFVMTGWRIGNIIAPSEIIKAIQQVNENIVYSAPSVSQRAALHALRHRKEIQPAITDEFKKRMFYAAERINTIPGFSVMSPPKGGIYLFVNIKDTGLSSKEVTELLLKEAHVLVLPGKDFGECGEGYIRIACTVGVEKLGEALERVRNLGIITF